MKTNRYPCALGAALTASLLMASSAFATDPPPPPEPGEIGDTVFCDLNENGIQEPGDFGLPGVEVCVSCRYTIWPDSVGPGPNEVEAVKQGPVELGVKFQTSEPGCVSAIRFYKSYEGELQRGADPQDTVGKLWCVNADGSGQVLAEVAFASDDAVGWLQADLAAPALIEPGKTYVVSYFAAGGCFAATRTYFQNGGVSNGALETLGNPDGGNGVYLYHDDAYDGTAFPTESYRASNYWVDVVFEPKEATKTTTNSSGKYLVQVPGGSTCTVSIDPNTAPPTCNRVIDECPIEMTGIEVPPGGSYLDADFCLSPPLPEDGVIGDTVWCDENENGIQDPGEAGIPGVTVNLVCANSIWSDTDEPAGVVGVGEDIPRELGLKFQSKVDGCVSGVRFYKNAACIGTHTGNLWDSAGNNLATVTFSDETADGWQDAQFGTPVAISANTTYVVSYSAPNGCYSFTSGYFAAGGLQNGPLCALQDGVDGGNGLFAGVGEFPTSTFNSNNYWVDVIFEPKALTRSTTTDSNGKYLFTGLPEGAVCTVSIDPSTAPADCNRVIEKCPTEIGGIVVVPGVPYLDADFCLAPPQDGEIGDTVFCDRNRNGMQDDGEEGLPNVKVTLVCETASGTVMLMTFTNSDGKYLFTGLEAGECTVSVDPNTAPPDCNIIIDECPLEILVDLGAGESYLDADFCFAPCDLQVEAFCAIPRAPGGSDGDDCDDSKVTAVTIRYTAKDCDASSNSQDADKAKCEDFGTLVDDVYMIVSDRGNADDAIDGEGKTWFSGPVSKGNSITATAANGGDDKFASNTYVYILAGPDGPVLQKAQFHTSCSQPLAVGNQFGANLIAGLSFEDGRTVSLPGGEPNVRECVIPLPGGVICPDGDDVYALELLYTGDDCDAMSHSQDSSKVDCDDIGPLGDGVWVVVSDKEKPHEALRGDGKTYFAGSADLNDVVVATAAHADEDKFSSETYIHVFSGPGGGLLQSVKFHTSCSQPLATGDQFGGFNVVGADTKTGKVSLMGTAECVPHCDIQLTPGAICPDGDDVFAIEFLYTAEDCSATSHGQNSDKVECEDHDPLDDKVYVVVSDEDKASDALAGDGKTYFAGLVEVNTVFEATAANAGEDKFSSSTYIYAFEDEDGGLLQSIEFHTSCSQPLTTDDQFGAFAIYGADTKEGSVSEGAEVTFVYEVSNTGDGTLTDVMVTDNFGEVDGSPIASIGAGETVLLYRFVSTSEDIINTVTVSSDGANCEDSDITTVDLIPPPPGPIVCTSSIKAMLLTYIGPNVAGPVTVAVEPSSGPTITYQLPGGLSTGQTLSSQGQNGFTIDAAAAGEDSLGSKVFLTIDGTQPDSGIHTSCSAPFVVGQPAPLNEPKGAPSPNWFVESFTQKN